MNENKEQTNTKEKENNITIPTVNYNGTPNLNKTSSNQEENNIHTRVRRPLQYNSYMMNRLTRNGYIGLQILIIILTFATVLGMLIGATIFMYNK